MTVTVYGRSCSSTRKAKQWLKENGIPYVERNITQDPITIGELHSILRITENGTDEIMAVKSQTYQDMNANLEDLSLHELIEYINKYPKLLKSPIIVDEKRLQAGYSEDIRQFLPRKTRLKWRMNHLAFNRLGDVTN
ncbi:Spx/MgsR family RNA polymerase-binding regulatory protein [Rossellomorea vietnamensis]|uniref:Spx/MgsR family RNA polymerase-binding regulatory protein n=1 Tax=Rossellomorea vietnamensis TaxID=218284 RepID=UPI003CEE7E49